MCTSNRCHRKNPYPPKIRSHFQRRNHVRRSLQSRSGRANRPAGGRRTESLICVLEGHFETYTAQGSTAIRNTSMDIPGCHRSRTWTSDPSAGAACDSRDIVPRPGSPEVIRKICFSCRKDQHTEHLLTRGGADMTVADEGEIELFFFHTVNAGHLNGFEQHSSGVRIVEGIYQVSFTTARTMA